MALDCIWSVLPGSAWPGSTCKYYTRTPSHPAVCCREEQGSNATNATTFPSIFISPAFIYPEMPMGIGVSAETFLLKHEAEGGIDPLHHMLPGGSVRLFCSEG
jgi:hypothetical protein